jgi:hypothetical protein
MSAAAQVEATVEVRLRYRPVGDVLTVLVRSEGPPGSMFQMDLDGDISIEWVRMADGTRQIAAMQILGALARYGDGEHTSELPVTLRRPAMELMDRGGRHHGHPSTHRPLQPTGTYEAVLRIAGESMTFSSGSAVLAAPALADTTALPIA